MDLKRFLNSKKPSPFLKLRWAIKDVEYRAADDDRWPEVRELIAKAMALAKTIEENC